MTERTSGGLCSHSRHGCLRNSGPQSNCIMARKSLCRHMPIARRLSEVSQAYLRRFCLYTRGCGGRRSIGKGNEKDAEHAAFSPDPVDDLNAIHESRVVVLFSDFATHVRTAVHKCEGHNSCPASESMEALFRKSTPTGSRDWMSRPERV